MPPPSFVGRDQELAALDEALAGPLRAVVLVEGEAGIGKTRLLREFLASSAGREHKVLVAECPPFRQPQTLGPVVTAVRRATGGVAGLKLSGLAGALRPLFPEWVAELPSAPEPAEDATAARHRVFGALAELLGLLQITALAVEDAQWADEATLEFALFLQPRVSLLVTYRPEEVPADSLVFRLSARPAPDSTQLRLTLGPLDTAETASLVSSMLDGEPVSAEFAGFLHQRTEGLPLAVEELVRLMHDRVDLARSSRGWVRHRLSEITVPPTVRDAVLERVGRLDADTKAMLLAAAVVSGPVADITLAAITGLPAERARAGLGEAIGCGLLAEAGGGLVAFRHVLAAQAVREAIPSPDLRALHLRAASALEELTPAPIHQLAWHFREAGEMAQWCHYGELAADGALAAGDEATAFTLLHDLLAHAVLSAAQLAALASKVPTAAFTAYADYEEVVRTLREAIDVGIADPGDEAEVRLQLGRMLMAIDELEAGQAQLEQAIPRLRHLTNEAALAMINLGWPGGTTWSAQVHLRWLRRAAEIPPSDEPGERLRRVVHQMSALLTLGEQDGWAEAEKIPSEPRSASERLQVTRGLLNIGDGAMRWGRYDEAGERLARARDLANEFGYSRLLDDIQGTQCLLDWFTGAWDGLAERATTLAADEDFPVSKAEFVLVIGLLHATVGEDAQAEEALSLALDEARRCGAVEFCVEPAAGLARLALARGRTRDALELTDELAGVVSGKGIWLWATDLGPARVAALVASGQTASARRFVEEFAGGVRGRDIPSARAALALCQAIMAEGDGAHARAADLFAQAAVAWQALPRPYDALLSDERRGICLLAAGETAAGVGLLSEVYRGLSGLGATAQAERVADRLREQRVDIRRVRRGRRGYGDQLSPRELDVVRLVAVGGTNKDIARALSRSPNTIAGQINSAMRKLGVSSRTELAIRAIQAGIGPSD